MAALYGDCMTVLLHEHSFNEGNVKESGKASTQFQNNIIVYKQYLTLARTGQDYTDLILGVQPDHGFISPDCCNARLAAFFSARRRLKKADNWAEQSAANTPPVRVTLWL